MSKRIPIAVGLVVLAVVGAGGYLLFSDSDAPIDHREPPIQPIPTTTFEFQEVQVRAQTTGKPGAGPGSDAERAAREVEFVMNTLYTVAFADQVHWGDYGDAWALFEAGTARQAQADVETLTLGAAASDLYETLTPEQGDSRLAIAVLTDARKSPVSAIAQVDFSAVAELIDGNVTAINSDGVYFLRRSGGEWLIYGYRTDRSERAADPSPSAEPSS